MYMVHPTPKVTVYLVSHAIIIFIVSHSPPQSSAIAPLTGLLTHYNYVIRNRPYKEISK